MNVDPAVGKILGMVMAYAVSALGLLLAYYNYRTRIVKADRTARKMLLVISACGTRSLSLVTMSRRDSWR